MQDNFLCDFQGVRIHQFGAMFRHLATQNLTNVDQGMAAANQADVMGAVANNVAVSAQDGIHQCYRIQRSASRKRVTNIRWVHSRPREEVLQDTILPDIAGYKNGPSGSFLAWLSPRERLVRVF